MAEVVPIVRVSLEDWLMEPLAIVVEAPTIISPSAKTVPLKPAWSATNKSLPFITNRVLDMVSAIVPSTPTERLELTAICVPAELERVGIVLTAPSRSITSPALLVPPTPVKVNEPLVLLCRVSSFWNSMSVTMLVESKSRAVVMPPAADEMIKASLTASSVSALCRVSRVSVVPVPVPPASLLVMTTSRWATPSVVASLVEANVQ